MGRKKSALRERLTAAEARIRTLEGELQEARGLADHMVETFVDLGRALGKGRPLGFMQFPPHGFAAVVAYSTKLELAAATAQTELTIARYRDAQAAACSEHTFS